MGTLSPKQALTMGFQLHESLMKLSGVTYGVAGIAAAIVTAIMIAKLTRRPNVSKMTKTTHSPTEF